MSASSLGCLHRHAVVRTRERGGVKLTDARHHYNETRALIAREDALFTGAAPDSDNAIAPLKPDPLQPSAILLVGKHRGASMHALLWVDRLLPDHFKNMIFLAVGEVDAQSKATLEIQTRLRISKANSWCFYR